VIRDDDVSGCPIIQFAVLNTTRSNDICPRLCVVFSHVDRGVAMC
jgi:hypothetical protein